jgi:putative hydrolase of the HAD superfamily
MKLRAVGFDLGDTLIFYDGTPLNWSAQYPEALRVTAAACGVSVKPDQLTEAGKLLASYNTRLAPRTKEVTADEIFTRVLKCWGLDAAKHLPASAEAFFNFFQQTMRAYPETVAALQSLRAQSIPTGILTDVPYGMPRNLVERDINKAGIFGLFDVLITSVEVGVRKPETKGFLALAAALGFAPAEMLYVGNELKDVIGANRVGMRTAFLDREKTDANHGQDFTIATLRELESLLTR